MKLDIFGRGKTNVTICFLWSLLHNGGDTVIMAPVNLGFAFIFSSISSQISMDLPVLFSVVAYNSYVRRNGTMQYVRI